ncbi:MAG: hypothetical protein HY871_05185, partial [Chloroflexi bacterium]|nr:hypothetical protein [Chloroflexota bacterium]
MNTLLTMLSTTVLLPPLTAEESAAAAAKLGELSGLRVYPGSLAASGGVVFFLGRTEERKFLGILSREGHVAATAFVGEEKAFDENGEKYQLKISSLDHVNAAALRRALPYTGPVPLGLQKSVGLGDRLGLATPGHVRAVRGTGLAPIFAQQSIREMARTGRTPEQVLDDVTWGVFQEGWRQGFGADADHLKTPNDIGICVAAGFTFYTIDPSEHVDNAADTEDAATLAHKVEALPWGNLEYTLADLRRAYVGRAFIVGDGLRLSFSEETLFRAAAKYGRAVAHTALMYRHLAGRLGDKPFELEVSVDETATPTSPAEHCFVASELKRLGVKWVSLAPRFVGRFEKGVDYIGDLAGFERDFVWHVAVARHFGPHKLGIHSGSDKFSIYPIVARHAGNLVHLKTAGTSYLEALRAVASIDPVLFRQVLAFSLERYEQDKASYHVSADPSKVPAPDQLADPELAGVL